jgi:HK97 family phage portal protein
MRWIDRLSHAFKAFRLGPAVVENADRYFGTDPENYAPSVYGDYLVASSAVYACANLKARNISSLPIRFFAGEDTKRQEITRGPIVDLFKKVNPHWTYQRLMQMTQLSMDIWGEAFWVLERDARGIPVEIWWARPDRMRIVPHPEKYIEGYIYDWNGQRIGFTSDEVVWFRYPNPLDEYTGLSPISSARLAIDTGVSALRSNANIFRNGVQLAGVLSPMDKDAVWQREQVDALRDMLDRRFRGVDKAHRIAILGQSAMFSPMSISPKDAQFMELMTWTRSDIAMVFQVPPELIGDHSHATYSNINQAYKGFWTDCLVPQATMIANEITEQLVKLFPGVDEAVLDYSSVTALQQDANAISEQAMRWFQMGVPLNKILHELAPNLLPENMGRYPWGETPGNQPQPEEQPEPETQPVNQQRSLKIRNKQVLLYGSPEHQEFEQELSKFHGKLENLMVESYGGNFSGQLKAITDYLENLPEDDFVFVSIDDFSARIREVLDSSQNVPDLGVAVGVALGMSFDFAQRTQSLGDAPLSPSDARVNVDTIVSESLQLINDTTAQTASNAWQQSGGDVGAIVGAVTADMNTRIELIGTTQATKIMNRGALIAARQSGKKLLKQWVSMQDGVVRNTHISAHQRYSLNPIPLEQNFVVGRGAGPQPGSIGVPEEDVNCRCGLRFIPIEGSP